MSTLSRKARLGRTGLAESIILTQRRNHTHVVSGGRTDIGRKFDDVEPRIGAHRRIPLLRRHIAPRGGENPSEFLHQRIVTLRRADTRRTTAAVGMRATPTRVDADATAARDVAALTSASNVCRESFANSQPDIPVGEL